MALAYLLYGFFLCGVVTLVVLLIDAAVRGGRKSDW